MKIHSFPVGENAIICDDSGDAICEVRSYDIAKEICNRWNAVEDQIQYKIQNIATIDAIQYYGDACQPRQIPAGSGCSIGPSKNEEPVRNTLLALEGDTTES